MVKVVTDSTGYLEKQAVKELDIQVLSLNVEFEGDTYREVDLNNEDFYSMMEERGVPKSSQPPVGDFIQAFEAILEEGQEVLGVFLSGSMSGTLTTAMMARDMVLKKYPEGKIELLDSQSNCMQLGFAVEAAAKAAKEGKSLEAVKSAAERMKERSRFLFVPKNLKYLQKGGRIGKANALIGNLLSIIPILTVEQGETAIFKKVRRKKKAVEEMVNKLLSDHGEYQVKEVVIHHIAALEEGKDLARRIEETLDVPVRVLDIGPVIGLHVGPGAIGIAYHTKEAEKTTKDS
ncbi:DegV family protein [Isachenkonia alkalipeptolytica]|uniref:DegV family protein n=1 Tax=Isachenkonia alkalipeptolytica TaxID=2565777 RepID=A0AA43XLL7_9CLOT|nr:DegV family protein [Isachenkonia alkalipeptolytica]NBG88681.1 DegV family protein [Isachenkonia alkalipeptolytica]